MERVKIFCDECDESEKLEGLINQWLSKNAGLEITAVTQSQSGRLGQYVTISIFYRPPLT